MKKKFKLKLVDKSAITLLIVGGINWGLNALGFNLVEFIASFTLPIIATIIYTSISISAVWVGARALMGKIKFIR